MPTRSMRKRPPAPVTAAGQPSADAILAGLSLLAMFGNTAGAKQAKATLEAMQAATQANSSALEGFGPADRIADMAAQAELDRSTAATEPANAGSRYVLPTAWSICGADLAARRMASFATSTPYSRTPVSVGAAASCRR